MTLTPAVVSVSGAVGFERNGDRISVKYLCCRDYVACSYSDIPCQLHIDPLPTYLVRYAAYLSVWRNNGMPFPCSPSFPQIALALKWIRLVDCQLWESRY